VFAKKPIKYYVSLHDMLMCLTNQQKYQSGATAAVAEEKTMNMRNFEIQQFTRVLLGSDNSSIKRFFRDRLYLRYDEQNAR